MKKLLIPGIFLVPLVAGAIFALFWWKMSLQAVSDDASSVRIVIPKGRSAVQIGNQLYEEGLIKSPLAFKIYVQLTGRADQIQAGEFELSKNLTPPAIIDKLSRGPLQLWVTIPEGLRREEIAERFIKSMEMETERASQFRSEFLEESATVEGMLFPDTYLFPRDVTGVQVARRMNDVFDERVTIGLKDQIEKSELTFNEVVVLASIIERETKSKEERPIVAGILMNRIEEGMPLQADATAQYAWASIRCRNTTDCNWWRQVTREELQIDSPYNTYKILGLPPEPIANPGLTAVEAALNPEANDYFYYIHEPNGTIHYARTLEEHNENVNEYLR